MANFQHNVAYILQVQMFQRCTAAPLPEVRAANNIHSTSFLALQIIAWRWLTLILPLYYPKTLLGSVVNEYGKEEIIHIWDVKSDVRKETVLLASGNSRHKNFILFDMKK